MHKDAFGRTLALADEVCLRRGGARGIVVALGPDDRVTVRWEGEREDMTVDPLLVKRVIPGAGE